MRIRQASLEALVVAAIATAEARAAEIVFCVGGDEAKGKATAEAAGGKWTKENLPKAFGWAAEQLGHKDNSVTIKIAAGDYVGEHALPGFNSPKGKLRVQGGWSADFTKRDPFHTPSRIMAASVRKGPLIEFNAKDQIGTIALDGLILDVGPSNKYDQKSNSLKKGESSSHWILRFNNLKVTDAVLIENCVLMNSPARGTETLIHTNSDKTEIKFYNTIFLNCLIPVKLDSCRQKTIPAKITVNHCSFICNWAYNPDPDTSNPAALECAGKYAANEIEISDSLFFANFGGAIMNMEVAKTKVTIKNNNFVGNGLLHGNPDPKACCVITNGKMPIPLNKIVDEEEDKTLAGNVSISPGLPIALGDPKGIDSSKVKAEKGWENDVKRLLGRPLDGGKVSVKDFAPKREWDPANPPFPTEDEAKKYGASPDLVK